MRAQPPSKHDCADLLWEAIPLMAIADRSSPQPRRWSDDGADRRRYRPAFSWKAIALKTSCKGQCIMKERPAFQGRSWRGAAPAAPRCSGLRSATAALGSKWSGVSGAKGLQQSIGKSAGEWHFTLGGSKR